MSDHTKTPVRVRFNPHVIYDANDQPYASTSFHEHRVDIDADRAAHIVVAVNAFEALVAACEEIMLSVGDDCPTDEPRDWYLAGAYDRAEAALKLAKGEAT